LSDFQRTQEEVAEAGRQFAGLIEERVAAERRKAQV